MAVAGQSGTIKNRHAIRIHSPEKAGIVRASKANPLFDASGTGHVFLVGRGVLLAFEPLKFAHTLNHYHSTWNFTTHNQIHTAMNDFNRPPAGNPVNAFLPNQHGFPQRILVVEDEGDLRQLNAQVLADAGYEVDVAEDGASAWAALQLKNYDLMLTGQFLPKLSGVELLKKIHTTRMTLPVIMATGILPTWEFALHPCLQSVTMLRKPYTIDKLLGTVKSILPENANVGAGMASAEGWQTQPAHERSRLC
jgi:CheY-like chemotaxis protein